MFIIHVDGLPIRLPDSQSVFNPRYAFAFKGSSAVGLKVCQTGHLLLPIDLEGNIAVSPGESYLLVNLVERRKPQSTTGTEEGHLKSASLNNDSNSNKGSIRQTNQGNQKNPSKPPIPGTIGVTDSIAKIIDKGPKPKRHEMLDTSIQDGNKKLETNTEGTESEKNDSAKPSNETLSENTSLADLFQTTTTISPKKKRNGKRSRAPDDETNENSAEVRRTNNTSIQMRKHPLDSSDSD